MPPSSPSASGWRWPVLRRWCALALPWTLTVSCALRADKRAAASAREAAAARVAVETRVGVVRTVGADQRFVLIETPSASATAALSEGQILHCRPPDAVNRAASADLRVSRERHQSLLVADVVAGEPAVGAIVYFTPASIPAAAPAPDSISAVSTAPLPSLFGPRKP